MEKFNISIHTWSSAKDKAGSKMMNFKDDDQAAIFAQHLANFTGDIIRVSRKVYEGNGYYYHPQN